MPRAARVIQGPVILAGIDGCRAGWFAVISSLSAPDAPPCTWQLSSLVAEDIATLMAAPLLQVVTCVAIDIPIGLHADRPRACDALLRKALPGKAASVFSAPIRPVLDCEAYAEANACSKEAIGKGLTKQAWNIVPKIRDVDRWITPARQSMMIEAHPELGFARLNGAPLLSRKATPEGQQGRLNALDAAGLTQAPAILAEARERYKVSKLKNDDILDALVNLLAAQAAVLGTGVRFEAGETDARGLRITVNG